LKKRVLSVLLALALVLSFAVMACAEETIGPVPGVTGDIGAGTTNATINNDTTTDNTSNTNINISGNTTINNSNIGSNNQVNQQNTVTNTNTVTVKKYVTVNVNGVPLEADVKPFINQDNRTVLPLRAIAEAFGAELQWDPATQTVLLTLGDRSVRLKIGDKTFEVNGQVFTMDTTAFIEGGRTFLPARAIAEALGLTVGWNAETDTVDITAPSEGSTTPTYGTPTTGQPVTGDSTTVHPAEPVEDTSWQDAFPLTANGRNDKIDDNSDQHMESNATLNISGQLQVTTRTWTDARTSGFTGGVAVGLLDANNVIIWVSTQQSYGVDGSWIGTNDRTENWSATVPQDKLKVGVKLLIVHDHAGKNRLVEFVGGVGEAVSDAADLLTPDLPWPF